MIDEKRTLVNLSPVYIPRDKSDENDAITILKASEIEHDYTPWIRSDLSGEDIARNINKE